MARRSAGLRHDAPTGNEIDGRNVEGRNVDRRNVHGRKRRKLAAPQHLALLRLDVEALWRGHVEGEELCEIAGVGPIPVSAASALLGDAVLKLVLTRGVDVLNVTSLTRGPTQAMHYARLWTSPMCTVEGCTKTRIEHDHRWGAEYKDTRHTRLDELDPLCHHHHALHTLEGWALVAGTGHRPMVSPDDPGHPANAPPPGRTVDQRAPTTGRAPPDEGGQTDLFGNPAA